MSRALRAYNCPVYYNSRVESILRFFSGDSKGGAEDGGRPLVNEQGDSNTIVKRKPQTHTTDSTIWQQWSGGGPTSPPSPVASSPSAQERNESKPPKPTPKFTSKDPNKDWKSVSRAQRSVQDRIAAILVPEEGTASHPSGRYDVLGTATDAPRHVPGASSRAEEISPRRLLPHRLFYPGATYSPEELDPYKAKPVTMLSDLVVRRGSIQPRVVEASNDFRNPNFLNNFITESGKINPRRQTRLPAKLHRNVVRQIKLARSLALMCPTARVHLQGPQDSDERPARRDANSQQLGKRQDGNRWNRRKEEKQTSV